MLPVTHLLVGLAVGVWGFGSGLFAGEYVIYTAAVSTLIDLDHLAGYFRSGGGSVREHWNRLVLDRLRYRRTFIHHAGGMAVTCLLIALTYGFDRSLFYCLSLAYGPHMILDHLHLKHLPHIRRYHLKGLGVIIPYSIVEVLLDAAVIGYLVGWGLA